MMKLLVLVFLCASVGAQDPLTKCMDLETQELIASDLVTQSPLRVVYANDPDYSCSSVFYTSPVKDSTYTIGSTYNKGDKVLANLQLTFDSSNQFDTVEQCNGGEPTNHRFLKLDIAQDQGYCIFTCSPDGASFTTLRCMDRGGLTQSVFNEVLTMVQGVPGGPSSGTTLDTCADPTGSCAYFNF